ncbi:hypothetical protein HK104_004709, partial [Borealophlyctis nickersoniae]
MIHPKKHHARTFQFKALAFPLHNPTIAVAPVIQQLHVTRGNNGDSRSQFHREPTGGRVVRDVVTQVRHDAPPTKEETEVDGDTTKEEDPDRDGDVGFGEDTGLPDSVDGGQGTHGVCDVVGAVGEGGKGGGEDLDECVEVLGFGFVFCRVAVDVLDVGGLGGGDVAVDVAEELVFDPLGG